MALTISNEMWSNHTIDPYLLRQLKIVVAFEMWGADLFDGSFVNGVMWLTMTG